MEAQYQLSYWEKNTFFSAIDVLIIGAGMVGLSAAVFLKRRSPNLNVVVLERGSLPIGASTRNAGFACFGSLTELIADLQHQTEDQVWSLVEKRWRGLQQLRELLGEEAMDFQQNGGYELFLEKDEAAFEQCAAAIAGYNRQLSSITGKQSVLTIADREIDKFGFKNVKHLILNRAEGQIDTGKMMRALLALAREMGVQVFNGIDVAQIDQESADVVVHTANGWTIRAAKMIVATNGFARQLLPDLEVRPARNQVLITAPVPGLKIKGCFHYEEGFFYFRNIHNRILLGGGRNLDLQGEETDQFGTTKQIQEHLTGMLHTVILPEQQTKIENWWSGILGVGEHKLPIIQKVHPNVVVAVRLGGMGIAIGNLVGQQAAEML